jgi:hypothetical protein
VQQITWEAISLFLFKEEALRTSRGCANATLAFGTVEMLQLWTREVYIGCGHLTLVIILVIPTTFYTHYVMVFNSNMN